MNTHNDKTSENKSQATANSLSKLQGNSESSAEFVDNRPSAIAQRKLQASIQNSRRVQQLKAYQEMADNSPKAKQPAQLQAIPKTNTPAPIQRVIENDTTQLLEAPEGDELLQGKFKTIQRVSWEAIEELGEAKLGAILEKITPDALEAQLENLDPKTQEEVIAKMRMVATKRDMQQKLTVLSTKIEGAKAAFAEKFHRGERGFDSLYDERPGVERPAKQTRAQKVIAGFYKKGGVGVTEAAKKQILGEKSLVAKAKNFFTNRENPRLLQEIEALRWKKEELTKGLRRMHHDVDDGEKLKQRAKYVQGAGKVIAVALNAAPIPGLGAIGTAIEGVGHGMEAYGAHLAQQGMQVIIKYALEPTLLDAIDKEYANEEEKAKLRAAASVLKAAAGPLGEAVEAVNFIFDALPEIPVFIDEWNLAQQLPGSVPGLVPDSGKDASDTGTIDKEVVENKIKAIQKKCEKKVKAIENKAAVMKTILDQIADNPDWERAWVAHQEMEERRKIRKTGGYDGVIDAANRQDEWGLNRSESESEEEQGHDGSKSKSMGKQKTKRRSKVRSLTRAAQSEFGDDSDSDGSESESESEEEKENSVLPGAPDGQGHDGSESESEKEEENPVTPPAGDTLVDFMKEKNLFLPGSNSKKKPEQKPTGRLPKGDTLVDFMKGKNLFLPGSNSKKKPEPNPEGQLPTGGDVLDLLRKDLGVGGSESESEKEQKPASIARLFARAAQDESDSDGYESESEEGQGHDGSKSESESEEGQGHDGSKSKSEKVPKQKPTGRLPAGGDMANNDKKTKKGKPAEQKIKGEAHANRNATIEDLTNLLKYLNSSAEKQEQGPPQEKQKESVEPKEDNIDSLWADVMAGFKD